LGAQAIAILSQWSQHFNQVTPLASRNIWDIRGNQSRLYAGWSIPNFTKDASLLWDDPAFTPAMKTQFSSWLWNTWLMQHAVLTEDVHDPGVVLGQNSWNGRDTAYQVRIFAGLTMKAAGNPNGELVINDTIAKIASRLPEDLYYGTAPWHQVIGSPWPVQPLSYQGSYYTSTDHMRIWWKIDNTLARPFTTNMIGITVETGRDIGHQQLGTASLAEAFTALRINGYGDQFSSARLGSVLLQLGEKEAKVYNEALDAYWSSPGSYVLSGASTVDGTSCGWTPSEWPSYHFVPVTKSTKCPTSGPATVTFNMGGSAADNGWEFLRSGLKLDGYATPQMDRLVARLRGAGSPNVTHVAGHGVVGLANSAGWDPLFALDYH
jgi:hypothetical protein